MLPGLSGSALIAEIRQSSQIPVIVLSAKAELADKVELLGLGADDYLTKPYQLEELWARILVQLRHASAAPVGQLLRYRDWVLNLEERTLTAAGQLVSLTAHEFKIVELLAGRPKRVFTKQQIYEAVWQEEYAVEDKTITVHVSNIRAKLRPSGTDGYIQTVWGIGFKLAE
jgi:DNA-binding response OmpR family regulator